VYQQAESRVQDLSLNRVKRYAKRRGKGLCVQADLRFVLKAPLARLELDDRQPTPWAHDQTIDCAAKNFAGVIRANERERNLVTFLEDLKYYLQLLKSL
jgi:hypothetical protein